MRFYLIDDQSESYFVGQIERKPEEVEPHLRELAIGETWWNPSDPSKGFERFA